MPRKKTVLVDFDGVLHSYTSGWKGPTIIPDPPVEGAIEWLDRLLQDGRFKVCIFSTRNHQEGAIEAMREYLLENGIPTALVAQLDFPLKKIPAVLTIDDRGFHFRGKFPTLDSIAEFSPWHKEDSPLVEQEDDADKDTDMGTHLSECVRVGMSGVSPLQAGFPTISVNRNLDEGVWDVLVTWGTSYEGRVHISSTIEGKELELTCRSVGEQIMRDYKDLRREQDEKDNPQRKPQPGDRVSATTTIKGKEVTVEGKLLRIQEGSALGFEKAFIQTDDGSEIWRKYNSLERIPDLMVQKA